MALFASAVAGGVECASDEAVESVPCPFVSVASVEPSLLLDVVSLWAESVEVLEAVSEEPSVELEVDCSPVPDFVVSPVF